MSALLEVTNLSKRFGGLKAVDRLTFHTNEAEIFGLIGPNGSGKSTALSLIMGIISPDQGSSVKLDGLELCGLPAHRVAQAGISMVFQHSRPLARQTVLENIELALLPDTLFQLTTPRALTENALALADRVGLGDVVDRVPSELPYASLRRMELAKALAARPRLCLLDEPFAGLAPRETEEFSMLIDSLRSEGWTLILVDHNVHAVTRLVDRLVVLNAGQMIAEGNATAVTQDPKVREVYFGKGDRSEVATRPRADDPEGAENPFLDIALDAVTYGHGVALADIRLQVARGEFVSVVGLNGAGKTTLFNCIFGFKTYDGNITYEGGALKPRSSAQIAASGIAFCPETRELFASMTVKENLLLGGHSLAPSERGRQLDEVLDLFPRLRERLPQVASTLSGGEQQMLTIGRALMRQPKLLLLDEPTLGLAPLINEHISDALTQLQNEHNVTILLAEQNITFALRHSDRIYFLQNGRIQWHGPAAQFTNAVSENML